MRLTILIVC